MPCSPASAHIDPCCLAGARSTRRLSTGMYLVAGILLTQARPSVPALFWHINESACCIRDDIHSDAQALSHLPIPCPCHPLKLLVTLAARILLVMKSLAPGLVCCCRHAISIICGGAVDAIHSADSQYIWQCVLFHTHLHLEACASNKLQTHRLTSAQL